MYLDTDGVVLSFNDIIYSQLGGVLMGSPLGPILAYIFLSIFMKTFFLKNATISTFIIAMKMMILFELSVPLEGFVPST